LKDARWPTKPRAKIISHIWNLNHITPGAIAVSATLVHSLVKNLLTETDVMKACWTLSTGEELEAVGSTTNINWQDDILEVYINWIHNGLQKNKALIKNIICIWDSIFYPHTMTSLVGLNNNEQTAGSDIDKAEEALNNAEELLDDSEEDQTM
jgi:hypothetical protein